MTKGLTRNIRWYVRRIPSHLALMLMVLPLVISGQAPSYGFPGRAHVFSGVCMSAVPWPPPDDVPNAEAGQNASDPGQMAPSCPGCRLDLVEFSQFQVDDCPVPAESGSLVHLAWEGDGTAPVVSRGNGFDTPVDLWMPTTNDAGFRLKATGAGAEVASMMVIWSGFISDEFRELKVSAPANHRCFAVAMPRPMLGKLSDYCRLNLPVFVAVSLRKIKSREEIGTVYFKMDTKCDM